MIKGLVCANYRSLETFELERSERVIVVSERDPVGRSEAAAALLERNRRLVELAQVVVACWSGAEWGGTWQTIQVARRMGKPTV